MTPVLIPTEKEIREWLISTLQHACHVEYFLDALRLGSNDPQRPHDIVGAGNKFEWELIKGFALQYREPKPDFVAYIQPSLAIHRQQYHHMKWNEPDPNDITRPVPGATEDDMLVGAIDAVCSLLENRMYQGGMHNYNGIIETAKNNPPHKASWMLDVIPEMMRLEQPNLEAISSLNGFANIGLRQAVYDIISKRVHDTVDTLRKEHGYALRI